MAVDDKYSNLYNDNLLINSNFKINQTGKTVFNESYLLGHGGAIVDMWKCYISGDGEVNIVANGIELTKTSGEYVQLIQTLDYGMLSFGPYTLSTIINDIEYSGTVNYNGSEVEFYRDNNMYFRLFPATSALDIVFLSDGEYHIKWIKLEYGENVTLYIPNNKYIEESLIGKYNNLSNPNMLINSNFKINQRNLHTYTISGMYADMWHFSCPAGMEFQTIDNGIELTTTGASYFSQYFHGNIFVKNTTYTASLMIDGTLYSNTVYVGDDNTDVNNYIDFETDGLYYIHLLYDATDDLSIYRFGTSSRIGLTTWRATNCKLEVGDSVTKYTTPEVSSELVKCMYYHIDFGTYTSISKMRLRNGYIVINVPVPYGMIRIPNVTFDVDNTNNYVVVNGVVSRITALETLYFNGGGLDMICTVPSLSYPLPTTITIGLCQLIDLVFDVPHR